MTPIWGGGGSHKQGLTNEATQEQPQVCDRSIKRLSHPALAVKYSWDAFAQAGEGKCP